MSRTEVNQDNALFAKNIAFLESKVPALSKRLAGLSVAEGFEVEQARSGSPTLIYRSDGQETFLHSRYDPEQEAWRWAESLGHEWEMLVLFGMGLGYHLLAVSRLYPGKRVILVENDARHLLLPFYYLDLTHLWQYDLTLVVSPNAVTAAQQVSGILFNNLGCNQLLKALPAYQSLNAAYWSAFQREFSDQLTACQSALVTIATHRTRWWKNYSENFLEYLEAPGISSLFDRFAGVPAVIVAAGPSLEKNVHLLSALHDKVLIVAAGSAIGPLTRYGIRPHLLLSCDPTENNYNHFADLDGSDIPLVFASSIYYRIVREYRGLKFSFALNTMNDWPDRISGREKGVLQSGATVAVTCFDLAVRLGCDPIIFIGQDLAYSGMKTHAEGNFYARPVSDGESELFLTEGNNGPVYTSKALWTMKLHLENQISAVRQERRIVNATEGGAILRGAELLTFADAIERFCYLAAYPVGDIILNAARQRSPLRQAESRRLAAALGKLRREARLCGNCLTQAQALAKQLQTGATEETVTAERLDSAVQKFKKLEQKVQETELFRQFIKTMMIDCLSITAMTAGKKIAAAENINEKAGHAATGYLTWFSAVAEAAAYLEREVVRPVAKRLKG
jgi:hypothetical protein